MAIQPTDIFLINQSGTSYKVQAQYLGDSTGVLLVNRGGASYKVNVSDCSAKVQAGDLFLVNRNGDSYKVPGSDVLGLFGPAGATAVLTDADYETVSGSWSNYTHSTTKHWTVLGEGNGRLIALGSNYEALLSDNGGATWYDDGGFGPGRRNWRDIKYANGIWVTCCNSPSTIKTSSNGYQSWSNRSSNGKGWRTMAFKGSRWVIAGDGGALGISDNNFVSLSSSIGNPLGGMQAKDSAVGAGRYVVVGHAQNQGPQDQVISSTNGTSWTAYNLGASDYWETVAFDGNKFVAAGRTYTSISTDGINWTAHTALGDFPDDGYGMEYGNGYFFILRISTSEVGAWSRDGIAWVKTDKSALTRNSYSTMTFDNTNDRFVLCHYTWAGRANVPTGKSNSLGPSTDLTADSNKNLSTFSVGDEMKMIDSDGNVANYVPVTSTISSVSGTTLTFNSPNPDLKFFRPGDAIGSEAIVSVNTSNNTMEVTGGSWSVGNTVTGASRTGQGTIESISGSTVTLKDDNNGWIDNTNRLGTKFYAKDV